jgi:thiol reductant ABC exporter CydD subunit
VTPLERRLLGLSRAAVVQLGVSVLLGTVMAALAIGQAALLADAVSSTFVGGAGLDALTVTLLLLGAVLIGRAVAAWVGEASAHRAAASVKATLRAAILERGIQLGARRAGQHGSAEIVALATRGVDDLDAYYARYLPQLPLAVIVPVAVVVAIARADLVAALTVGLTVPVIVVFIALIGRTVEGRRRRRWQALTRFAHHFLDVVQGLPTLKVYGRAKAQVAALERVTDAYRVETMASLRTAFLSAFALEFFATLSVALVAVGIGVRLVEGSLDLRTGLFVLILAPEAYLPLRQLGLHFHASEEGRAAIRSAFELIDSPLPTAGSRVDLPDLRTATLSVDGLAVRQPGRELLAPDAASFQLRPGEVVALTGPNGAGKSSLLLAILGLAPVDAGSICLVGEDGATTSIAELDPSRWRRHVGWVPQVPFLSAGTLEDNVRLIAPDASEAAVREALDTVGLAGFELSHRLGEGGLGLSSGERRRVAVARALARDPAILLIDEPTAGLDEETERVVLGAIERRARDGGSMVVLVAHRPAAIALADRVVRVTSRGVTENVDRAEHADGTAAA